MAQHSTAQHSTAQHSIAQHSMAQHSSAGPSTIPSASNQCFCCPEVQHGACAAECTTSSNKGCKATKACDVMWWQRHACMQFICGGKAKVNCVLVCDYLQASCCQAVHHRCSKTRHQHCRSLQLLLAAEQATRYRQLTYSRTPKAVHHDGRKCCDCLTHASEFNGSDALPARHQCVLKPLHHADRYVDHSAALHQVPHYSAALNEFLPLLTKHQCMVGQL